MVGEAVWLRLNPLKEEAMGKHKTSACATISPRRELGGRVPTFDWRPWVADAIEFLSGKHRKGLFRSDFTKFTFSWWDNRLPDGTRPKASLLSQHTKTLWDSAHGPAPDLQNQSQDSLLNTGIEGRHFWRFAGELARVSFVGEFDAETQNGAHIEMLIGHMTLYCSHVLGINPDASLISGLVSVLCNCPLSNRVMARGHRTTMTLTAEGDKSMGKTVLLLTNT